MLVFDCVYFFFYNCSEYGNQFDLVPHCPEEKDEGQYIAFLKNGSRSDFGGIDHFVKNPSLTHV